MLYVKYYTFLTYIIHHDKYLTIKLLFAYIPDIAELTVLLVKTL